MPWNVPQKYFDLHPLGEIQLPPHATNDLDDIPSGGHEFARAMGDHARVLESGRWARRSIGASSPFGREHARAFYLGCAWRDETWRRLRTHRGFHVDLSDALQLGRNCGAEAC